MSFDFFFKRGIRPKIILAFILVGTLPVVAGLALTYWNGTFRLREALGENFRGLALEISRKADLMVEKEVLSMQNLAATSEIRRFAEDFNHFFIDLTHENTSKTLIKANKDWRGDANPVLRDAILKNGTTLGLENYMNVKNENFISFFLTDVEGALVASVNTVPDYFHGEEEWWNKTYNNGKGRVYIGELGFNEGARVFTIPLAVPVMNESGDEVIGILAVSHDLHRLLDPIISVVRFGKTGHAMLINSLGRVIVCPVMPTGSLLKDPKLVEAITSFAPRWVLARDDGHGGKDSIIGFSPLVTTTKITLESTGRSWHSFIRQDPKELYAPINSLLSSVYLSGFLLVGLVAFMGIFFSRRLTRPIQVLQKGAEEISKGNLKVNVDIRTNDEIEKLAHAFNDMARRLNGSYSNLEQKVADRTKELSALNDIAMTINQSLDLKLILNSTLQKILGALELDAGAVWLWDEKRVNLELQFSRGLSSDFLRENGKISLERIRGRFFLKSAFPVNFNEGGEVPPGAELLAREGFKSFLPDPLRSKDKIQGYILVASRKHRVFSPQDQKLLEAIGGGLSVAIENAMLYSETREMVKELEEADQYKTEFFSNVTHELRTPLTSIIGYSEFLLERFNKEFTARQKESIENIKFSGNYLLEIVNNLLNLSKIRAKKMDLHYGEFSARSLVLNCVKAVGSLALKNHITIKTNIDEKGLVLNADEIKARQILLNLLSNAIKFTPEGGEITVEARAAKLKGEDAVQISVADTGIGIHARDFEKIFQEFRQVDSSHTRKYGGSGLGLPIARRFIEMHGGTIEVASQPGKGSCFTFLLPSRVDMEKPEKQFEMDKP